MTSRTTKAGLALTVLCMGGLLTSCFTANLSGTGNGLSPIQYGGPIGPVAPSGSKKVEFNLKSLDSLGTGIGGASGRLKDHGKNPAFPNGVSLSFANGLTVGMGTDCTDEVGGPSRVAHSGAQSRGGIGLECGTYSDPRAWFGLVTYSSADPSRYPNQGFQPCNEYFQDWVMGVAGPTAPVSSRVRVSSKAGSSSRQPISGFGAAMIYDTNYNGNYDKGDRFGFISICGPYAYLDGSALFPEAPIPAGPSKSSGLFRSWNATAPVTPRNGSWLYNYGTCETFDEAPYGAMVNPGALEEFGPEYAFSALMSACNVRTYGGDLKIGIATRLTTTTTSTTAAP